MFEIGVICLNITAFLAYINHRWVGLPSTIGVMLIAMIISLALVSAHDSGFNTISQPALVFLHGIDFSAVLMDGMLSLLLFASALHVDLSQLRHFRWSIFGLAVIGTLASTIVVGVSVYYVLDWLNFNVPFWFCMVFGALISPTDAIAVMSVLRQHHAPANLEVIISGESLFNDGVGVVLFTVLLGIAVNGNTPSFTTISSLVLHEIGGGILLGFTLGALLYYMLRSIDNYRLEVMLTLASVLGGYLLATNLHVSGPLAMVITGLLIGNHGRKDAMSDVSRQHIDMFWELIDEMLNAILFVLLGLNIVLLSISWKLVGLSIIVILLTLIARWLTVGLPIKLSKKFLPLPHDSWKVFTWGGLRGGISVALALSLPLGNSRDVILTMTYGVVIFSMLGQGLTIGHVIKSCVQNNKDNKV